MALPRKQWKSWGWAIFIKGNLRNGIVKNMGTWLHDLKTKYYLGADKKQSVKSTFEDRWETRCSTHWMAVGVVREVWMWTGLSPFWFFCLRKWTTQETYTATRGGNLHCSSDFGSVVPTLNGLLCFVLFCFILFSLTGVYLGYFFEEC